MDGGGDGRPDSGAYRVNDFPILDGSLEIRARGDRRILAGRFPYGRTATVRSSGRTRKERFAPGALSWQVREFQKLMAEYSKVADKALDQGRREALEDALERRNTFLLVGHSYDRAVANMRSGSLSVNHTAVAVELEAELPGPDRMPSWVRDAVLAVEGGQLRGISPGFQVGAKGGERLVPEDGPGGSMVREILDAVAFEYSLVARPAYSGTDVDARAEELPAGRRQRIWL